MVQKAAIAEAQAFAIKDVAPKSPINEKTKDD